MVEAVRQPDRARPIAAALAVFAGYRIWLWYQASQTAQASAVYGELQKAATANDAKKVRDLAGT